MRLFQGLIIVMGLTISVSGDVWAGSQDIIFNEIMADPLNESKDEFVELYNRGDKAIDVAGWLLMDRSDINDALMDYDGIHDMGRAGTVLPPDGYALIVDPDYDGAYNDWISAHADTTRLIILTIRGDRTLGNGLGNSGDTIILDDNAGYLVEYTWPRSAGSDGRSWEKIDSSGDDDASNWSPARPEILTTPGAGNSVAPPRFDAGIVPESINVSPAKPSFGEIATVSLDVSNEGTDLISGMEVVIFSDQNHNNSMEPEEILRNTPAISLAPGVSSRIMLSWTIKAYGTQRIGILLSHPDDEYPNNNLRFHTIHVSFSTSAMVINEIMFDPDDDQAEWLELYNRSDFDVDLQNWTIETADSTKKKPLETSFLFVPAGQYVILTADTTRFADQYDSQGFHTIKPVGAWSALLNSGTTITLRDLTGKVMDQVVYDGAWSDRRGRSIERIHPDMLSSLEQSWGPSSSENGGTPGWQNSLYAVRIPSTLDVNIAPNPFSPDGDGVEDEVQITVHIPSSRAQIRALMFDVQGRTVRTISEERQVGNRWTVTWDGRMEDGRQARIGPYILFLEMQDLTKGIYRSMKKVIVLGKRL